MRNKFFADAEKNPNKYHQKDLEKLKTDDWWFERFALVNKNEDEALAALMKTMEWRKSFGVNDFTDESFPQEIHKIGLTSVYPHKDKEGRVLLWNRMSRHHKSDLGQLQRQYVVYMFEKADKQTSHQGWAQVADNTGAGLGNVEMDFSNFCTDVLQNHYPRGLKYNAVVDLPWILNATIKLMLAFMNEELRSTVKMIKKDELTQYIDQKFIPVHLKGSYEGEIGGVPPCAKPLEQFGNFTPDQIKKIRSTFKEELK